MSRCCSQCGTNGHNSRTCGESSSAVSGAAAMNGGDGEIMLFGVRVKVDPIRKSVSMNNLSQYEQVPIVNQNGAGNSDSKNSDELEKAVDDAAGAGGGGGYVSADDAVQHQSTGGRERKRGQIFVIISLLTFPLSFMLISTRMFFLSFLLLLTIF